MEKPVREPPDAMLSARFGGDDSNRAPVRRAAAGSRHLDASSKKPEDPGTDFVPPPVGAWPHGPTGE